MDSRSFEQMSRTVDCGSEARLYGVAATSGAELSVPLEKRIRAVPNFVIKSQYTYFTTQPVLRHVLARPERKRQSCFIGYASTIGI